MADDVPSVLEDIRVDIDTFNSRSKSFEEIMGKLCDRIDGLNDQMGFVMQFVTSGRLERLEKQCQNLVFNLQGFDPDPVDVAPPAAVPPRFRGAGRKVTHANHKPKASTPAPEPTSTAAAPAAPASAPAPTSNNQAEAAAEDMFAVEESSGGDESAPPSQAAPVVAGAPAPSPKEATAASSSAPSDTDSASAEGGELPKTKEVVNLQVFRGEDAESRKRWAWLISQVKMMCMLKRGTGLTNMRLPKNQSMASRIERIETRMDEYPKPEAIFEMMEEIDPIKERLQLLEEELPNLQEQLDGLMYLKEEVKMHGNDIRELQAKVTKNIEHIATLQADSAKHDDKLNTHDRKLGELEEHFKDLEDDLNRKLIELEEDIRAEIEEKINFQKQLEKEQLLQFEESMGTVGKLKDALECALERKRRLPKEKKILETTKEGLTTLEMETIVALQKVSSRDKEEKPTREVVEALQQLMSNCQVMLRKDAKILAQREEANSKMPGAGADVVPGWTPLGECMGEFGTEVSVEDVMKEVIECSIECLNPHLRLLRGQLNTEGIAEEDRFDRDFLLQKVDAKINLKAETVWVQTELDLKENKGPLDALTQRIDALQISIEAKQQEYTAKLGKSINETMARFNRLQEQIGTKAAKEQMARELEELDTKIMKLTGDNMDKAREFILNAVQDKVNRKELEDALRSLQGDDESSADLDVVASFMPFRCLACNKPLKKVQEVRKFAQQQSFFPPSSSHAPNSLHILRPQSSPSIPSKRNPGPIHTRLGSSDTKNDIFSRSTTSLPPPQLRGSGGKSSRIGMISGNSLTSTAGGGGMGQIPEGSSQVYASYPGFLPSMPKKLAKGGPGML